MTTWRFTPLVFTVPTAARWHPPTFWCSARTAQAARAVRSNGRKAI